MAFPVNNIRNFASKKGTTIAQLERKLGIGNGVIAKWEKAKAFPPYDRLLAIANELGVTVEDLTGESTEKTPQPLAGVENHDTERLSNLIDQMSKADLILMIERAPVGEEVRNIFIETAKRIIRNRG